MKKLIAMLLLPILLLVAGCNSSPPEEDLGEDYIMGTDQQYYFYTNYGLMCESEDSYYWLGTTSGLHLCMKDKKTGETTIMCNKPNCLHEKEPDSNRKMECNAYFPGCERMTYYQGKLYIHAAIHKGIDPNDDYQAIYEVDTAGSTRKEIYRSEEDLGTMITHRGYLYMTFSDFYELYEEEYKDNPELIEGCKCEVKRIPLNNPSQEPETIWKETEKPCQINAMFAYGNRVYLSITSEKVPGFQVYNIQDKSIYVPEIPLAGGCTPVWDGHLVGASEGLPPDKKVYQTDMDGNVEKELDLPSMGTMFWNGTYLVSDNDLEIGTGDVKPEDRAIKIYDMDYHLIREVKLGEDVLFEIGLNEQYYFYLKSDGGEGYDIWAVDLSRLDEEDLQGELFLPITSY